MNEETLFHLALEKPASERAAFLEQACGGDDDLRRRVAALLHAHDNPGSFLGQPPLAAGPLGGEAPAPATAGEVPGSRIGPYKLLQRIGEGGMGAVFMAEQTEPVQRRVALKVVKPGMDSAQVLARFEAERQALALMDHPNIAKVLDAGTTDNGRPYFVMELVKGVPITKYCDEHHLTPRDRLELFVPVCQAVQHAHHKGVIHRDLKPSNVLIAQYDGRPVPKVIDFGVAKATGPKLTERTLFTEFGAVVGTLEYMSPEQAQLNQLDVDTRSDVYSLGVLLYELLTGTTPLQPKRLKEAALLEVLRIIREEEPPRPSTRLSTTEELPTVAASRGLDPKKLSGLVRGELDWIVMKALEKDRNRRYESANALATDLERYLHDEPVLACPPGAGYRLRKFLRRHKRPVLAAASLLVLLVVGIVGTAIGLVRALQAEKLAGDRLDEVQAANGQTTQALADLREKQRQTEEALNFHRLALAERAREANDVRQVDRLLDECPAELRQWEWHYLKRSCHKELLTLRGHRGPVYFAAFSPDGSRIVSSSHVTAKVWDAGTGQELFTFVGNHPSFHVVGFTPDGRHLFGRKNGMEGAVWDAATGRELLALQGHTAVVNQVAVSPDGQYLATASTDMTVKVWQAATGVELFTLRGHRAPVHGVSFRADSRQLASVSSDKVVKLWDPATGMEIPTLQGRADGAYAVRFSTVGKLLATRSDGGALLLNLDKGAVVLALGTDSGLPTFGPDGKRLAAVGKDHVVSVWELATRQKLFTLRGHSVDVHALSFSPDSQRLATADHDGVVRVWDATTGTEALTRQGVRGNSYGLAFRPDGKQLVRVSRGSGALPPCAWEVWDPATGREAPSRTGPFGLYFHAAFRPNGPLIAVAAPAGPAGDDKAVALWDGAAGRELFTLRGHAARVAFVALNPDGSRLASSGIDGEVKLWDATTGKELTTLRGLGQGGGRLAFSLDNSRLAGSNIGSKDPSVTVWDTTTYQALFTRTGGDTRRVYGMAFSPDGSRLALGTEQGTIKVWDSGDGREVFALRGHTAIVHAVAFSPDGLRLATGSNDKTVRLWDPASGRELLTLQGHKGGVGAVAFGPDGHRLASADDLGFVKVWDGTPWEQKPAPGGEKQPEAKDVRTEK
jgi:WD40 repeat protein/serine/threonine protein kinase